MPYAEDFAHFGQNEQFKIKMKLKQRKKTRRSPQISRDQQFKDKNPAIRVFLR